MVEELLQKDGLNCELQKDKDGNAYLLADRGSVQKMCNKYHPPVVQKNPALDNPTIYDLKSTPEIVKKISKMPSDQVPQNIVLTVEDTITHSRVLVSYNTYKRLDGNYNEIVKQKKAWEEIDRLDDHIKRISALPTLSEEVKGVLLDDKYQRRQKQQEMLLNIRAKKPSSPVAKMSVAEQKEIMGATQAGK